MSRSSPSRASTPISHASLAIATHALRHPAHPRRSFGCARRAPGLADSAEPVRNGGRRIGIRGYLLVRAAQQTKPAGATTETTRSRIGARGPPELAAVPNQTGARTSHLPAAGRSPSRGKQIRTRATPLLPASRRDRSSHRPAELERFLRPARTRPRRCRAANLTAILVVCDLDAFGEINRLSAWWTRIACCARSLIASASPCAKAT